ncbi:nucleotidyltransferase [Spirochaetia bacterium]|nr:nucleotidyltransferase [Spirochaetia bacterium]
MNYFDTLVNTALENNPAYTGLRPAVEKEILHHDILSEMNKAGFLKSLTFIGGTCLRLCYGSERLSEDLDFAGGFDFKKSDIADLGVLLKNSLEKKYELPVQVSSPIKETGNVETWKIKMTTRPDRPNLPAQRINIDICLLPSHDPKPVMLRNFYRIETGTSGIIMYAESLEELLCDKLIALAMRPNRVKNRDLWDIFWLDRKNITLSKKLFPQKLEDRKISPNDFSVRYKNRLSEIQDHQKDFLFELRRFLSPQVFDDNFTSPIWWEWFLSMLEHLLLLIEQWHP